MALAKGNISNSASILVSSQSAYAYYIHIAHVYLYVYMFVSIVTLYPYITLHYMTCHDITLHCIAGHCIALYYNIIPYHTNPHIHSNISTPLAQIELYHGSLPVIGGIFYLLQDIDESAIALLNMPLETRNCNLQTRNSCVSTGSAGKLQLKLCRVRRWKNSPRRRVSLSESLQN